MTYDELHRRSLADPEGFWAEEAESVLWRKRWTRPLDSAAAPFYRWFPGGQLNTCENAVDRHVADGFGDQPALICDSPMTDSRRVFTYANCKRKSPCWPADWRARACKKATGLSFTCPWFRRRFLPCWPALGWAPSTRLFSADSAPRSWPPA